MAVLTDEEKGKIRRYLERVAIDNGIPISYVKGAVNDTAQALEDYLDNNQAAIVADMQAAAAAYGVTWTSPQLKQITAIVLSIKYIRDRSI